VTAVSVAAALEVFIVVDGGPGLLTVDDSIVLVVGGGVLGRSDNRCFAKACTASSVAVSTSRSSATTGDKGGETGGDRKPPDPDPDEDDADEAIEEAEFCRERGGIPLEEEEELEERTEEGVRERDVDAPPPPGEEGEGEKYFPRKDEANQDWRRVLR
jgi:hypothetical protein